MSTSTASAYVKRSAVVGAVLAAALIGGFGAQVSTVFDELWPLILGVVSPWALLLTTALTAIINSNTRLPRALLLGLMLGCLTAVLLVVGAFAPFALQVGGRELDDVGREGELPWSVMLGWGLTASGLGGVATGAACGTAAWALHARLGQKRADRER